MNFEQLHHRAQRYAALGDPSRLAIVDELTCSDRSPSELAEMLEIDSNLLAHHVGVLEQLGIVERVASQGDRRRRYVRLVRAALFSLQLGSPIAAGRIVFVCTENAARSQLAQALWNQIHLIGASSGGTEPADHLYPGAIQAAARRGIDLQQARPTPLPDLRTTDLIITVCDRAHETLKSPQGFRQLHWSVPDPSVSQELDAYDQTVTTLESRINVLAENIEAA